MYGPPSGVCGHLRAGMGPTTQPQSPPLHSAAAPGAQDPRQQGNAHNTPHQQATPLSRRRRTQRHKRQPPTPEYNTTVPPRLRRTQVPTHNTGPHPSAASLSLPHTVFIFKKAPVVVVCPFRPGALGQATGCDDGLWAASLRSSLRLGVIENVTAVCLTAPLHGMWTRGPPHTTTTRGGH